MRIVALGGGTGLSTVLRGLKDHVARRKKERVRRPIADLAAIVTVTDDGGSSGRLRRDYQVLPPGDIRSCMVALSKDEHLLSELFQYRFPAGRGLAGHSFGNLFLTALTNVTGDFPEAVRVSSQVLAIRGRIFPATVQNVTLEAELADGTTVAGETKISRSREPIRHVRLVPRRVKPLPEAIKAIRNRLPEMQLVAGNVATFEGARDLISLGIDGLKVGIGPGSICTTRIVTGAGVPQITAILEASKAAKGTGVPIVADGGIKYSGDITKAIAAGASCVMIGSLFAGTEEAPGETILYQGRTFKSYRGMGSTGAMEQGSADRYSQEGAERGKSVPEGVEGRVAYKGPLSGLTDQLVGGLKSGMGYVGARSLKELTEKSKFVRITAAGLRESHVHDVVITKEAPNYRME